MPSRELPKDNKFLVAFSFAGEQRDLVRSIAEAVEQRIGRSNVFLDEWYEFYISGSKSDLRLQDIYANRCELVVPCISGKYGEKTWTDTEFNAIRARQMMALSLGNQLDQFDIFPIRVGDGDVPGVLYNDIVPDVRKKSLEETVELILARLYHIRPDLREMDTVTLDWPEASPPLDWPMADHREAREAFMQFLTCHSPWRFLPIRGPSETGKSHITKQMLGNALSFPDLACGRFDFKGTTGMDDELQFFIQHLGISLPKPDLIAKRLSQVLELLKQKAQPTLLIFDTYERAGECQDWIEKQLLPSLMRSPWLRVVVAGQEAPNSFGVIWDKISHPIIALTLPTPPDWLIYGQQYHSDLTLEKVEIVCQLAGNKISTLADILGPPK